MDPLYPEVAGEPKSYGSSCRLLKGELERKAQRRSTLCRFLSIDLTPPLLDILKQRATLPVKLSAVRSSPRASTAI